MELTVSRTLPASSPTFSATSSLVAVICRMELDDSSALWVSVSRWLAISLTAAVRSLMRCEVSSAAAACVRTFSARRPAQRALVRRHVRVPCRELLRLFAALICQLGQGIVDLPRLGACVGRGARFLAPRRLARGLGPALQGV